MQPKTVAAFSQTEKTATFIRIGNFYFFKNFFFHSIK